MNRGPVIKLVDNVSENYTSDPIDVRNWDGLFIAVRDTSQSGSFSGSVRVLALLAGVNESGEEVDSESYLQYGGYLTVGRVERLEDLPAKVEIDVTRTAGSVTVYVQPYQRGRVR